MKSTDWLNLVLENRELRVKKHKELCEKYNSCVLSLTINIPGAKKNSNEAKIIYEAAIREIDNFDLKTYEKIVTCKDTGFEALYAFNSDAKELKFLTCKAEETHPLGRFMDIDVIDKDGVIFSRNVPRKCFVCEENAKVCARSQKHSMQELLKFIEKAVNDYTTSL